MTSFLVERCDIIWLHNDIIKWKHFPLYWPFVRGIHRSPVNSPHKGQWRRALMFYCTRINDWVNNGEAGDLRRHRTHYDVAVMYAHFSFLCVVHLCIPWSYMKTNTCYFRQMYSAGAFVTYIALLPTRLSLTVVNHGNGNVILTKFSSLTAPEVVFLSNSNAGSDENFIKMTIFSFQRCLPTFAIIRRSTGQLALTLLSSVVF